MRFDRYGVGVLKRHLREERHGGSLPDRILLDRGSRGSKSILRNDSPVKCSSALAEFGGVTRAEPPEILIAGAPEI